MPTPTGTALLSCWGSSDEGGGGAAVDSTEAVDSPEAVETEILDVPVGSATVVVTGTSEVSGAGRVAV